jgi:hypothetical protein
LLEARIFLDDRAAAERVIGQDIFQATVEMRDGKGSLKEERDSRSWDNEDVFVHQKNLGAVVARVECILSELHSRLINSKAERNLSILNASRNGRDSERFWR